MKTRQQQEPKFNGTQISHADLTKWILDRYKKYKITDLRYFGSRVNGSPRPDSDIDVYITFKNESAHNGKPIWTEIYKNIQIEFHGFIDFDDNYVPSWLIGNSTKNEIQRRQRIFT